MCKSFFQERRRQELEAFERERERAKAEYAARLREEEEQKLREQQEAAERKRREAAAAQAALQQENSSKRVRFEDEDQTDVREGESLYICRSRTFPLSMPSFSTIV